MPNVDIKIRRKKPRPSQQKRRRGRGPIDNEARSDDLGRRRRARGIRLFDLGQVRVGSSSTWQSIDIQVAPTLEGGTGFDDPGIRPVDLSDFAAVDNTFLSEAGVWSYRFRPIAKGGPLETNSKIQIVADSMSGFLPALPADKWTAGGLIVTNTDLTTGITIQNSTGFVESVTLIDDGTYKITTLPSFGASAVAFTPVAKMDVFLVPGLILPSIDDGHINSLGLVFAEVAGFFYTTIFRPYLFDSGSSFYNAFNPIEGSGAWPQFYYRVLYLKAMSVAKAGLLTSDPFGDFWTVIPIADIATVAGFPTPPATPTTNPPSGGTVPRYQVTFGLYGAYNSSFTRQDAVPGSLVAVVQKGNQKYYFWVP